MCEHVCMLVYLCECVFAHVYKCVCMCVSVCAYLWLSVCEGMGVWIWVCVCVSVNVCAHESECVQVQVCVCAFVRACVYQCVCIVFVCECVWVCFCMDVNVCVCVCECKHVCVRETCAPGTRGACPVVGCLPLFLLFLWNSLSLELELLSEARGQQAPAPPASVSRAAESMNVRKRLACYLAARIWIPALTHICIRSAFKRWPTSSAPEFWWAFRENFSSSVGLCWMGSEWHEGTLEHRV